MSQAIPPQLCFGLRPPQRGAIRFRHGLGRLLTGYLMPIFWFRRFGETPVLAISVMHIHHRLLGRSIAAASAFSRRRRTTVAPPPVIARMTLGDAGSAGRRLRLHARQVRHFQAIHYATRHSSVAVTGLYRTRPSAPLDRAYARRQADRGHARRDHPIPQGGTLMIGAIMTVNLLATAASIPHSPR